MKEYYVLFGVKSRQHQFKGPFKYEHQAEHYSKSVDKYHDPKVVVHYKGEPQCFGKCGQKPLVKKLVDLIMKQIRLLG